MRRRHKAAACLLIACLMTVPVPAEALAGESSAADDLQNMQQTAANEQTEGKPSGGLESGDVGDASAEDKKPEKEPDDKAPEKKEEPYDEDKGSQNTDKVSGEKAEESSKKDSKDRPKNEGKKAAEDKDDVKKEADGQSESVAIDPDDPGKYRLTGRLYINAGIDLYHRQTNYYGQTIRFDSNSWTNTPILYSSQLGAHIMLSYSL